jgi:hypothetical protein
MSAFVIDECAVSTLNGLRICSIAYNRYHDYYGSPHCCAPLRARLCKSGRPLDAFSAVKPHLHGRHALSIR